MRSAVFLLAASGLCALAMESTRANILAQFTFEIVTEVAASK
jgi:hypothetical protein